MSSPLFTAPRSRTAVTTESDRPLQPKFIRYTCKLSSSLRIFRSASTVEALRGEDHGRRSRYLTRHRKTGWLFQPKFEEGFARHRYLFTLASCGDNSSGCSAGACTDGSTLPAAGESAYERSESCAANDSFCCLATLPL